MYLFDTFVLAQKLRTKWPSWPCLKPPARLWALRGRRGPWALIRRQEAATSVEYAIVLAMVLMATFSAIQVVGNEAGFLWDGIIDELTRVGFFH